MSKVSKDQVISISYKLTDNGGQVIDQSSDDKPFAYLHGHGNIVSGLEEALEGKAVGDELEVKIPPEKGYGMRSEQLKEKVPREQFPAQDIQVGMQFTAESDQGAMVVTVAAVDDSHVTIDGNHPLAGVELNFAVKILGVRAATEEEVSHGHAH